MTFNFSNVGTTATIAQNTTNVADGYAFTIQAQNSTKATSTGGALNLTSGTGTSTAGNVVLQTGGTTKLTIAPTLITSVNPIAIGTTPPATGAIRLDDTAGNTLQMSYKYAGTDYELIRTRPSTSDIFFGHNNAFSTTFYGADVRISPGGVGTTIFGSTLATSSVPIAIGATPATTGTLRLANASTATVRDVSNTKDLYVFQANASNRLHIGGDDAQTATTQFNSTTINAGTGGYVNSVIGGTTVLYVDSAGANVYSGALSVGGTTTAATGNLRLPYLCEIKCRNSVNTADLNMISNYGGDIIVGDAVSIYNVSNRGSSFVYNQIGGVDKLTIGASTIDASVPLTIGTTPATDGLIRVPYSAAARTVLSMRNVAGTGNESFISTAGNYITFGDAGTGTISGVTFAAGANGTATLSGFNLALTATNGNQGIDVSAGGSYGIFVTSTAIKTGQPVIGDTRASSPWAVHGVGTQAITDSGTPTTPAAAVYCYNTIKTTGALTANRNLVLPSSGTDARGYTKIINNTCTGAFSVVVGDGGAGTTVTVANGTNATVLFDSRGATNVGSAGSSFTAPTGSGLMTTTSGAMNSAASSITTNALTFLGTPSSANLLAALTDKTGTGLSVFDTSPTFKTGILLNNPANTFAYTFTPAAIAAARTITLPLLTANDTLVTEAFAQTLTSKTLTSPIIQTSTVIRNPANTFSYTLTPSAITANLALTIPLITVADTLVVTTLAQTLANKTISGASNTITNVPISTGISGLGSGIATFLATPSSTNFATALTGVLPISKTTNAASAVAALAIDWSLSAVFTKTLSAGSNTFTFTNAASGMTIMVRLTGAASTVIWPTVKWAGGVIPTQTASGTDVYTFIHDGTSIYGSVVQAMA
jgi:hypothetical protein